MSYQLSLMITLRFDSHNLESSHGIRSREHVLDQLLHSVEYAKICATLARTNSSKRVDIYLQLHGSWPFYFGVANCGYLPKSQTNFDRINERSFIILIDDKCLVV
jgi:hypothetical protein